MTQEDPWANPGSSTGVNYEEINGRLLIIRPRSVETVNTSLGEKECIRGDLIVIDGPGAPVEYLDTLVFPKVLIGQLRSSVGAGKMILGRLGQGVAKPGQNAPWKLADPDAADRKIARAWYETQASTLPF